MIDWTTAILILAGVVGGIVNAVAGGATLITFPALLATGLNPVVANIANAIAVSPGHLLAVLADRRSLCLRVRTGLIPLIFISRPTRRSPTSRPASLSSIVMRGRP